MASKEISRFIYNQVHISPEEDIKIISKERAKRGAKIGTAIGSTIFAASALYAISRSGIPTKSEDIKDVTELAALYMGSHTLLGAA
jgi:hypothetical protein